MCIAAAVCLMSGSLESMVSASNSKKEEYYKEYQKIVKETNEKLGREDFRLGSIDEIDESEMLTPEEFRKSVDALIKLDEQEAVLDEDNFDVQPLASGETVTASKSKKVNIAKTTASIKCKVTLVTRYNSSSKRRFITQIKNCSTTVSGNGFQWKKTPTISKSVIDGGRTAYVKVSGVIKNRAALEKQVGLSYYFYCNSGGGIN